MVTAEADLDGVERRLQDLHRFHGLHREPPGSALPQYLTTRQASLALQTAQLLPQTGLSTLGFDPTRFQTKPPACYRASWQLPGPDSLTPTSDDELSIRS